jgi:tetratricopeptide (TPR) repeat protein
MPRFVSRLLRRSPDVSARLPRPRFWPRFVALLASVFVLVLLAAWFADHPWHPPGWLDPGGVIGWVVQRIQYVFAGVGSLFDKDPTAAGVIGAHIEFFLVAFAAIVSLRWLTFWRLTARPGPIEVSDLATTATGAASGAEAATASDAERLSPYVTMMLREKLTSVSVYLPTPGPGDAVGGGFLQTMRESTRDSWWASVIEFVTRIIPRSAYRVDGAMLRRNGNDESYGVSVRVTVLPRQRTVANTVWGATPEEAAERAARVVGAAILPLTRRCLASPWRHWYGRTLPVELIEEYEEASAFREQRRYDEALGRYQAALDRDSLNPLIRLEMAQIQEQLGLYLDALANYDTALALWAGSPERYNSWLHGKPVEGTGRHPFTAWQRWQRWRRHGNPFPGRYRYALALAYFEKLAPQWVKPEGDDPRARERARLRHMLVKTLAERYGPVWRPNDEGRPHLVAQAGDSKAEHLRTTLETLTCDARSTDQDVARKARTKLKMIFLLMSRHELRQLVRDHSSWLGWAEDSDLTTRSLKLARDSWIDLRLTCAEHDLDEDGAVPKIAEVKASLTGLSNRIERVTESSSLWMEHYNAACVYGQAMVLVRGDDMHRTYARAAVKELFAGLESADSSQVSRQRSWILSEDADLRELRTCSEFQRFAAAISSAGGPVVLRPRRTQIAELGEYQVRLLRECARTMEYRWTEWSARAQAATGLERDGWVDEDAYAWWMVHQLAVGYRNWPDRLEAIRYFRHRPSSDPSWQVALPDLATFIPPEVDRADAGHELAARVEDWSNDFIKRGNLCQILVALWIRENFRSEPTPRRFTHVAAPTADDCPTRVGRWQELSRYVALGQAATKKPGDPEEAKAIVKKANDTLGGELPSSTVDWEEPAWRWAERQRAAYPCRESGLTGAPALALARAFAALSIAYEGVGDAATPLAHARRLIDS